MQRPSRANQTSAAQQSAEQSVLVVDDSRAIQSLLCTHLQVMGIRAVECAGTLAQTRVRLTDRPERFFVAVLDLNLPDAPDGEVVDFVQRYSIPIIVLTGNLNDQLRHQMLRRELVDYVLKRNTSEIEYVAELVAQFRDNPSRKVLLVEDDVGFRDYLKRLLSVHRYELLEAENGRQGLQLLQEHPDIQLIITDYNMPEMRGDQLIEQVRQSYKREELAIIGISTPVNPQVSVRLLKAGANDFINKPFEVEEFYCRVNLNLAMITRIRQIFDAATRDFLTGLYNRRQLFELGQSLYANARRGQYTLAAAMVDADHFKRVNDIHGHQMGDAALVWLAKTMQQCMRESDLVARFGGEEFVILAVGTTRADAITAFERLRVAIEAMEIPLDQGVLNITVSIGVTLELSDSLEKMLGKADEALYQAKHSGRNRVVCL